MTERERPIGSEPIGLSDTKTERVLNLLHTPDDCKIYDGEGQTTARSAKYYDEPFLNPKLPAPLAAGMSQAIRKMQLFDQVNLPLMIQRQAGLRSDLLMYARQNYRPSALAGVPA